MKTLLIRFENLIAKLRGLKGRRITDSEVNDLLDFSNCGVKGRAHGRGCN